MLRIAFIIIGMFAFMIAIAPDPCGDPTDESGVRFSKKDHTKRVIDGGQLPVKEEEDAPQER